MLIETSYDLCPDGGSKRLLQQETISAATVTVYKGTRLCRKLQQTQSKHLIALGSTHLNQTEFLVLEGNYLKVLSYDMTKASASEWTFSTRTTNITGYSLSTDQEKAVISSRDGLTWL